MATAFTRDAFSKVNQEGEMKMRQWVLGIALGVLVFGSLGISSASAAADGYYKGMPQFHMYPDANAPRYSIKRFGPVGIGLELRKPNFTIFITNVEPGSPAEACGKLKKGQIIESINGETLKDEDPRVLLGNMITKAEANDGIMKLMVKDDPKATAQEVVVTLPALGAYSDTWPVNCKKSDQIVRNFADFLAENRESAGIGLDGAMLFMLSTGEEKDLEVVRKWIATIVAKHKDAKEIKTYPWFAGYSGPALCEYYLRTGDESILPVIEKLAAYLTRTIYNGCWMGRGGASYGYMGGGHMNAAGVHCVAFLAMAKECGVKVDEHTLQSALLQFYRFAGRGNVAYGDGEPEGGMVSNGRTTGLALAMQAAANLHPDGEKSVYAKARDISATKGFYSTSWLFHGHTGGGIGELWTGQSMGLVKDKRPLQYRTFMDERRWMYELARTHDGVFGWISDWNVSYTDTAKSGRGWGNWIPLIYTIPRQQLRLYGAPPTKYSKTYKIPDRPWGNAADDVFYSMIPSEYKPGKTQDVSKEELITDASMPIMGRINDPEVDDDTLLMYANHIDQGIRTASARAINNGGRTHLVVPLLKSKDPRARLAGITCIIGMGKGKPLPIEQVTDEMFNLAAGMVNDPDEAWWVALGAMKALSRANAEQVAPHVESLMSWLDHDEWWLRNAAMKALAPVVSDNRFYKQILSKTGEIVASDTRGKVFDSLRGIVEELKTADPEVQQFAIQTFAKAYQAFPTNMMAPGGQDLNSNIPALLESIGSAITGIPHGYDELYRIAPSRFPETALPHEKLFFAADVTQFGPKLKKAFLPIIMDDMIPAYIEKNRKALDAEMKSRQPGRAIDGLVALYKKAGHDDYDWKLHGPARDKIKWQYTTFDPPETKLWEGNHRFREVTLPTGATNWFTAEFNPKAAGWKIAKAPFANLDGKLAPIGECKAEGDRNFCGCGEPPATFWDKEVLLMRSEIKLPPLKDGYAYRLLVGGRSHYNAGGGSDVWIDGEHLKNRRSTWATIPAGSGRHSGRPWGVAIDNARRTHFEDGKVLLACNGFLRWGHRYDAIKSYKTFWFEVMKLPELPAVKE
jgi:hypothetical protein